jgi:hypothetical protein
MWITFTPNQGKHCREYSVYDYFCPRKAFTETPTSKIMELEQKVFGRWLGHEGGALMKKD